MSTSYRYALPVEQTEWKFDGHTDVTFTWEYDDNRAGLLQLYSKGKQQEVWERLGLPVDECIEILDHSETMQLFPAGCSPVSCRPSRISVSGRRRCRRPSPRWERS